MKCPVCKGSGDLSVTPKMTDLQVKEYAVYVLKLNGFGIREIQRLMGFRSPRSVQQHLERREKRKSKEPPANTADVLLDTLDSLGLALAEHNHQWPSSLRNKYDNAVGLLVGKTSLPSGHQHTQHKMVAHTESMAGADTGTYKRERRGPCTCSPV